MISHSLSRADYQDATDLMARFGDEAQAQAVTRAKDSRNRGNIIRFCAWRQVERLIVVLAGDQVTGTIH